MRAPAARRAYAVVVLAKNHMANVVANAAPTTNNRKVLQDQPAGTVASAARSRSLISFGSTSCTAFALAVSVGPTPVAPGALAPESSVFGRTGQGVAAVATRLPFRLSLLKG